MGHCRKQGRSNRKRCKCLRKQLCEKCIVNISEVLLFSISKACLGDAIEQFLERNLLFKYISQVVIYDLKVNTELMRFPLLSLVKTSLWWQLYVLTSVWHIETSINHVRAFMCARLAFIIDGYSGVAYESLGTPNENVFSNALRGLCNNTLWTRRAR